MKKKNIYVPAFCVLLISAAGAMGLFRVRAPQPPHLQRYIRYSFTLQNRTNRVVKGAEFWTHAPVKETSMQRCERLETSRPYEVLSDGSGNQVLHFTFDSLPPYGACILSINAELFLSNQRDGPPVKDLGVYLRPEAYCESDDPQILQLAHDLRGSDPLRTAERVFKWVSSNVRFSGYAPNARGALYALKNKKGDCTEFMYLFAALCRANGIPTRCMGGYVCAKDEVLSPNGYHNWAEFYHQGKWRLADPQGGVFIKDHERYIAMRIISGPAGEPLSGFERFRVKGEGLSIKMNG